MFKHSYYYQRLIYYLDQSYQDQRIEQKIKKLGKFGYNVKKNIGLSYWQCKQETDYEFKRFGEKYVECIFECAHIDVEQIQAQKLNIKINYVICGLVFILIIIQFTYNRINDCKEAAKKDPNFQIQQRIQKELELMQQKQQKENQFNGKNQEQQYNQLPVNKEDSIDSQHDNEKQ
ncbi:hypothetical protein PPERSA_03806 [Pseudocohnilembus persalinus]|uniref:Transmembrane protein n=1 Tax=Pseudocohnilembus persalinus TaxID=266149 RepID=A0A0V0QUU4_PSEPJ|nr:hypothetical protein PPERSA_03806 [Pseudocohnilembus persalinus]|eukprot:KRX05869.1 hypothetical protein PPERSA_03806 [Pseudocohnilembus persalinus]